MNKTEIKERLFVTLLLPLINENYEQRRLGLLPDEWFWADAIAVNWGYWVDYDGRGRCLDECYE